MKTYKQKYQDAMSKNSELHELLMKTRQYARDCEVALKMNGIVNPVIYKQLQEKYDFALKALRAIRLLHPNISNESMIAQEALHQLEEKL